MKDVREIFRYIAEKDSEEILTSYWKVRFLAGEYYHVSAYDDTYCVVMGVFDVRMKDKGKMEIKPFVLKEDCRKFLTYKP